MEKRATCGCTVLIFPLGVCGHEEDERVFQAALLLLTEQITACAPETLLRQQRAQPDADNHRRQQQHPLMES